MSIQYRFLGKKITDKPMLEQYLKSEKIHCENIVFAKQTHGASVLTVGEKHNYENLNEADAITTNLPNIALAVVTADCAPIIVYDEVAKVIGIIHAGWRGARSDVISSAIYEMKKLGANMARAIAVVGPMIHQKNYQVPGEFKNNFLLEDKNNKIFFIEDASKAHHYLFDLPSYVCSKLQNENISQIKSSEIDTYSDQKYFSCRLSTHQNSASGRNFSVVICQT
jgi:YfiH family protein